MEIIDELEPTRRGFYAGCIGYFGSAGQMDTCIVLRTAMILVGGWLISQFHWVLYVFGAFLVVTGIKMWWAADQESDLESNPALKFLRKVMPVTKHFDGEKFWTVHNGVKMATPLLLIVALVGFTDVIFAVDSIPAIYAITSDPFIVLTSNMGSDVLAAQPEGEPASMVQGQVMNVVRQHFRPEFLNRVDETVVFHPLATAQLVKIVEIQLERLRARLMERRITLAITNAALTYLGERGYDPVYGARPLKRLRIAVNMASLSTDGARPVASAAATLACVTARALVPFRPMLWPNLQRFALASPCPSRSCLTRK